MDRLIAGLGAVGRWAWHHRMTVYVLVLSVVVIVIVSHQKQANDQTQHLAEVTQQQADALRDVIDQLKAETLIRTTQSCANQVASREANRNALLGLLDELQPKDENGKPIPIPPQSQARLDALRARVDKDLPPLKCDSDGTAIVIATPSSSTTEG